MPVRQDSGSWQARFKHRGEQYAKRFKTKAAAEKWERAIRRELKKLPALTVAELCEAWVEGRENEIRHSSKEHSVVKSRIAAHKIGTTSIDELRASEVDAWVRQLSKSKLSRASVVHALRIVRCAFDDAVVRGVAKNNPAAGVKVPRDKSIKQERPFLTTEEIARVFEVVKSDKPRTAFYAFAIYAGLRRSEIVRMRWEDVEMKTRTLHVRGEDVKTSSAIRTVAMLAPLHAALKKLGPKKSGLIFTGRDGGMLGESYTAGWRDRVKRVGGKAVSTPGVRSLAKINERVRFHDLRHTWCSHLVMGSWGPPIDLYTLRKLAGHSSITTTQRYAHLAPGGPVSAMAKLKP